MWSNKILENVQPQYFKKQNKMNGSPSLTGHKPINLSLIHVTKKTVK